MVHEGPLDYYCCMKGAGGRAPLQSENPRNQEKAETERRSTVVRSPDTSDQTEEGVRKEGEGGGGRKWD